MKHIFDISMLQPGMKIAENIVDPKRRITLVSKGTVLTADLIRRLSERGDIYEIAVDLSPEEKRIYQFDFNVIPTVNTSTIKGATAAIKSIDGTKPLNDKTIEDIIAYAKKIVESILMNNNFTYKLTDYKMNTAVNEHAVRTATYAVALAKAYNDTLSDLTNAKEKREKTISLENIAIAALLHDVGKLCADERVRKGIKKYPLFGDICPGLTKDKYFELQEKYDENFASYYSYNIINDTLSLPSEVKAMVLFSSEDEAGLGPLKLQQRAISSTVSHIVAAKMINICSCFDEYMMDNIKEEITLENAYEKFRSMFTDNMFDQSYLDLFIETIPLYPVGTKVILHGTISGYAIVIDTYKDSTKYSRPIVVTVPGKMRVDLSEERDTTIKQVVGDKVKMYELLKNSTMSNEEEIDKEYGRAI